MQLKNLPLDSNIDVQSWKPSEICTPIKYYINSVVQFLLEKKWEGFDSLQDFNPGNLSSPVMQNPLLIGMYEQLINLETDDQLRKNLMYLLRIISSWTYMIDNISFNDVRQNQVSIEDIRADVWADVDIIGWPAVYTTVNVNVIWSVGNCLSNLSNYIDSNLIEQVRLVLTPFRNTSHSFNTYSPRVIKLNYAIQDLLDHHLGVK